MKDVVFVNPDKHDRAKLIVAGKTGPELGPTTVASWAPKLMEFAKENPKATEEDKILFVYQGLGGLVRTPAEQAVANRVKDQAQARVTADKKRKAEDD